MTEWWVAMSLLECKWMSHRIKLQALGVPELLGVPLLRAINVIEIWFSPEMLSRKRTVASCNVNSTVWQDNHIQIQQLGSIAKVSIMVATRDSMNSASYNLADKFICKNISVPELCQTGGWWWCFNSITQSQKRRSAVHLLVGELKLQRVDWQLTIIIFDKCYIFTAILSQPPTHRSSSWTTKLYECKFIGNTF